MTKTEAEEFLEKWWHIHSYVFRFRREFLSDEYIIISKADPNSYVPDKANSTFRLEPMDRATILTMIMSNQLVYVSEKSWSTDCRTLKTGGCECGAWKIKDTPGHSDWCKLYKKP